MYTVDNNDQIVANRHPEPPNTTKKLWTQDYFFNAPDQTNLDLMLDPKYALFGNYLKTEKVYMCPSDKPTFKIGGVTYPKVRSYSLNVYVGYVGEWDNRIGPLDGYGRPVYKVFRKHSEIIRTMPARLF